MFELRGSGDRKFGAVNVQEKSVLSVGLAAMDIPNQAAKQQNKPDTGQCNLDKAAINLNAIRDVCRTELTRLLAVRPSLLLFRL